MDSSQLHLTQLLNIKQFRTCFPQTVQTKMVWLGLACLLLLVLLTEFILAMVAAHVLFANFAGPIITAVSQRLYEWKCA